MRGHQCLAKFRMEMEPHIGKLEGASGWKECCYERNTSAFQDDPRRYTIKASKKVDRQLCSGRTSWRISDGTVYLGEGLTVPEDRI